MAIGWKVSASLLLVAVALAGAVTDARADQQPQGPATVLTGEGVWRIFEQLKPPVVANGGGEEGLKSITSKYEWLDRDTATVPQDWASPEFVDSAWRRGNVHSESHSPYLADLYLRSHFEVTDPAAVKNLQFSATFHGGLILYVNGQEVARANVKNGSAVADVYPRGAFVDDKDELLGGGWNAKKKAVALRDRTLVNVAIPSSALKKGVNVLGIQVVRAPYDASVADYWKRNAAKDQRELNKNDPDVPYDFAWYTCEISDVNLIAGSAAGLVPNSSRPRELQIWNGDLLTPDYSSDFGDRCETLRPVLIQGPRNGSSSGKVVLGSPHAIDGLKVTCGDLKQAGAAAIPAAQIRTRYAVEFDDHQSNPEAMECLLESPLASFPATREGCVVPVWFTVKVPAGAKPGDYIGEATIAVTGEKDITVPIHLRVADFTEPNPHDFRTWIEMMESPDTLAAEYNIPLWSDKHWDLINQSMRYIGDIGNRVVMIPLIAQTNSGNAQSMVRWIKKPDGTYDYDFSVMDKYLDLAVKNMGQPKYVAFIAWEIYLNTPKSEVKVTEADKKDSYRAMEKSWLAARWDLRGKGPAVTTLNPATHELATDYLPRFEDPAAPAVWKPLFAELHKKMAQRGLEDTMLLGMASDYWPSTPEMKVLEDVSGNLPWINQTHGGSHVGRKLDDIATVAYTAYVWNTQYATDPDKGRLYGWKRPEMYAEYRRFSSLNAWPLASLLLYPEIEITGAQRGLGRVGGDFWPVLKDKRGERRGWVWNKYPQSGWHSCNLMDHMLDPGPDGPVASSRYEMMREGVQECEARITIESALTDDAQKAKLGDALANKCQALLDDRIWQELKAFSDLQLTGRTYASSKNVWGYGCGGEAGGEWYAGLPWQDGAQRLYDLAGEVTQKLAK